MPARFILAALAATLGAAAATPSPAQAPEERPAVREATLKNGMKVLLLEDHAAPVATFSVFYKVGSRNETTGATGSAHLLEHMMFKGTKRFGKGQIMATLDRIGAEWNATTFYDYTNYYETVPIDRLDLVMELEADRMRGSLILEQERDLERIVVRNELERGEKSPTHALMQDLWAAAFKAHPYHHPVIGWTSDVEGVPTARLKEFYRTYYQPDNAVAVLVGDFRADEALAMVRRHFERIPGGHTFPPVRTEEPEQTGERRITLNKPGDMKVVALGWRAPPASHPDTIALKLLHLILSGELDLGPFGDPLAPGIGNRLYQGLVEQELATAVGVDYTPMRDPGLLAVMALPRPEVPHEKVEKAIRAQMERLKAELVTDEELLRAKNRAAAAYGLLQDGTSGRAMLLGYFAAIADWRLADEFPTRVAAVTAQDIQRVARKYLDDNALTVGWFVPTTPPAEAEKHTLHHLSRGRLEAFKGFDGASLTASLAAGPPAARPSPATLPKVERVVLPNGLTLLVRENHASPTFDIAGVVFAGDAYDPAEAPGTATLTAESLLRGTAKRSKLELARSLEEVGASLWYSSGAETVTLSAEGLSKDLERVLDLLAETLTEPSFPEAEVAKLKRELIAELQQAEDSTSTKATRALLQGLYPKGHPYYVHSLEDSVAAVERLEPKALQAFHKARYGADSVVLAVVGDVKTADVVAAIEQRLGKMPRLGGPRVTVPAVALRDVPSQETVFVSGKPNVDVLLGHQGALSRTSEDYYPAMIANFVFGGSASARLFQEVRDRLGLTYGIYSSLSAGHGAGPWQIEMTLNPANVEKALSIVREMASRLVERGLTAQELAAAKETLVGRYKVGLATNDGIAGVLATFESYGFPPDFIDRHPERIEAVTLPQVASVLRRHFHPDRMLTVLCGSLPTKQGGADPTDTPPMDDAPIPAP